MTINGKVVTIEEAYDQLAPLTESQVREMISTHQLVVRDDERQSLLDYSIIRSNYDYRVELEKARRMSGARQ